MAKNDFGHKVRELLEKRGILFEIISVDVDPKIEREVNDYVMGIEEAHRRAASSKLKFRNPIEVSQVGTSHFLYT
jgi:hypothetical protein